MKSNCSEIKCITEQIGDVGKQMYEIMHVSAHLANGETFSLNCSILYEELNLIAKFKSLLFLCINIEDGRLIMVKKEECENLPLKRISIYNNHYYYNFNHNRQFVITENNYC